MGLLDLLVLMLNKDLEFEIRIMEPGLLMFSSLEEQYMEGLLLFLCPDAVGFIYVSTSVSKFDYKFWKLLIMSSNACRENWCIRA